MLLPYINTIKDMRQRLFLLYEINILPCFMSIWLSTGIIPFLPYKPKYQGNHNDKNKFIYEGFNP